VPGPETSEFAKSIFFIFKISTKNCTSSNDQKLTFK